MSFNEVLGTPSNQIEVVKPIGPSGNTAAAIGALGEIGASLVEKYARGKDEKFLTQVSDELLSTVDKERLALEQRGGKDVASFYAKVNSRLNQIAVANPRLAADIRKRVKEDLGFNPATNQATVLAQGAASTFAAKTAALDSALKFGSELRKEDGSLDEEGTLQQMQRMNVLAAQMEQAKTQAETLKLTEARKSDLLVQKTIPVVTERVAQRMQSVLSKSTKGVLDPNGRSALMQGFATDRTTLEADLYKQGMSTDAVAQVLKSYDTSVDGYTKLADAQVNLPKDMVEHLQNNDIMSQPEAVRKVLALKDSLPIVWNDTPQATKEEFTNWLSGNVERMPPAAAHQLLRSPDKLTDDGAFLSALDGAASSTEPANQIVLGDNVGKGEVQARIAQIVDPVQREVAARAAMRIGQSAVKAKFNKDLPRITDELTIGGDTAIGDVSFDPKAGIFKLIKDQKAIDKAVNKYGADVDMTFGGLGIGPGKTTDDRLERAQGLVDVLNRRLQSQVYMYGKLLGEKQGDTAKSVSNILYGNKQQEQPSAGTAAPATSGAPIKLRFVNGKFVKE
jgi:hypothetical protein